MILVLPLALSSLPVLPLRFGAVFPGGAALRVATEVSASRVVLARHTDQAGVACVGVEAEAQIVQPGVLSCTPVSRCRREAAGSPAAWPSTSRAPVQRYAPAYDLTGAARA